MLAGGPIHDCWDCDADETAGQQLEGCGMEAVDEVGADVGCEQREEVDCSGCDEVVPVMC